ncbi:flagellar hook-length control protein FliK [Pseudomonas sp. M30-35]|uniref:flagellar hook-length control protein FliK n=1 Tax=Pseudomonas sp. M30-35 TaxID=1981174 RepID=UPI000B3C47F9|nr:flagellar hook-length control protein FliK [Pseudomonas sp. M30-35]ARU89144.1 flagellar hook-length control protein FliK [Pseudomonas sp. M30-35]
MSEISSNRPLPAIPASNRPSSVASDMAVKLLQPLEGLLAKGESATAEVISLKQVAQSFQLMLKLTMGNGRQTTLEASSNRPIAQGTALTVTGLTDSKLLVALLAGGDKPLKRLDLNQIPAGTLIQGKVLSSEQIAQSKAQHAIYKVLVSLLNTSLAGSKLAIETPLSLKPGSLLSAQVMGNQSLNLLPLSGRLDQLVLNQQLQSQHNSQGSLQGLFKSLQGMSERADIPSGVRTSIDKLIGALPDGQQLSDAKGLSKALENSGAFLESKLLSPQTGALPTDLKANLLKLISQLQLNLPTQGAVPGAAAGAIMAQSLPALARNLLGNINQNSSKQQALNFPLPTRLLQALSEDGDLETLLKLAAAAVSRLQTHQLSSLAQSQVGPDGNILTTWQLELPMRNQQELVPVQLKIQRDEPQKSAAQEQKDMLWRIDLAFDLEPLGPVQVQTQLARGCLSSTLWAEQPSTAKLIDSELVNLRQRLVDAGLQVSDLSCAQGTPPQGPKTALQQRWVDETA